jgi:hypothetical protein
MPSGVGEDKFHKSENVAIAELLADRQLARVELLQHGGCHRVIGHYMAGAVHYFHMVFIKIVRKNARNTRIY